MTNFATFMERGFLPVYKYDIKGLISYNFQGNTCKPGSRGSWLFLSMIQCRIHVQLKNTKYNTYRLFESVCQELGSLVLFHPL